MLPKKWTRVQPRISVRGIFSHELTPCWSESGELIDPSWVNLSRNIASDVCLTVIDQMERRRELHHWSSSYTFCLVAKTPLWVHSLRVIIIRGVNSLSLMDATVIRPLSLSVLQRIKNYVRYGVGLSLVVTTRSDCSKISVWIFRMGNPTDCHTGSIKRRPGDRSTVTTTAVNGVGPVHASSAKTLPVLMRGGYGVIACHTASLKRHILEVWRYDS